MHVCRGVGMCMYRGVGMGWHGHVCEEWLACVYINSGWHVRVCRVVGTCVCAEGLAHACGKNGGMHMSMWDWLVHVCIEYRIWHVQPTPVPPPAPTPVPPPATTSPALPPPAPTPPAPPPLARSTTSTTQRASISSTSSTRSTRKQH